MGLADGLVEHTTASLELRNDVLHSRPLPLELLVGTRDDSVHSLAVDVKLLRGLGDHKPESFFCGCLRDLRLQDVAEAIVDILDSSVDGGADHLRDFGVAWRGHGCGR